MPDITELGARVKEKYPGNYDDMSDLDLGRRVKEKYPDSYGDFTEETTGNMRQPRGSELTTVHDRVMASADDIIGVQKTLLGDVPVRRPLTMEQLQGRAAAGTDPVAQAPEGIGATIGEFALGTAGSVIAPGVGTIAGGALGAAAGQAVEDFVLKGEINPKAVAGEAALSLLPEVAETVVRGAARGVIRATPGAKLIRFEEAAQRARKLPGVVFDPPGKKEVSALFEQVRKSGVKIDTSSVRGYAQGLTPGKYDELLSEVRRIDRGLKTGGRYATLMENMRAQAPGASIAGYDIGDLQTLRSELRKRKEALVPVEAKQLLDDFQSEVDDAIDFGLARGSVVAGSTPQILKEARRGWARMRSAEEMSHMIEGSITSTPDLRMQTFNLRSFFDNIRKGASRQAKQINRSMDLTPGGRAQFDKSVKKISELYKTIEMPLTDVATFRRAAVVGGLGQMLSAIMLTDVGRRLFTDAVLYGRGRVSPNLVAMIASYARREFMGEEIPFMESTEGP